MSVDVVKNEAALWRAHARVEKWTEDQVEIVRAYAGTKTPDGDTMRRYFKPEVVEVPDNLLTTAGLNRIGSLIIGAGGQALTQAATRLGVGNSSTAAAVGQTDLQAAAGSGNRQFKILDTAPTNVNGLLTFKASYQTGEANFTWNEWALDVGAPTVTDGTTVNALMVNRRVPGTSMGTKTSGVWTLTVTVTLA